MSQSNLLSVNLPQIQPVASFTDWKVNLDFLCRDVFGTTTENLPDMPYWYMYQEQVEENLIIQRIQTVIRFKG